MDNQMSRVGGSAPSVGQRMYQAFNQMSPVDAPTVTSDIPGQMGRQGPGVKIGQPIPSAGGAPDPFADNPLFQAGFQRAQQAAVDATMRGEDPYQAAFQAAHAGVREAAQPKTGPDGQGATPADRNLLKVSQWLQQEKGLDPDKALAMAHQIMPSLGGGGGQ